MCHHSCLTAAKINSSNLLSSAVAELLNENDSAQSNSPAYQQAASRASPAVRKRVVIMAEIIKKKKKQTKIKQDSESEEEDLDFVVADSDDGSRDGDDDLDRAEGKRKRDSSSDEDSSDSDSDSDDDDIDHVMSKDEVAALKKDQGNVIPRAKRRAALASGIGDASALEAIQQAKPDSDEEAEFEF